MRSQHAHDVTALGSFLFFVAYSTASSRPLHSLHSHPLLNFSAGAYSFIMSKLDSLVHLVLLSLFFALSVRGEMTGEIVSCSG